MVDDLKKVLFDTYAIYFKTQNYHWNVRGPQFMMLHLLLEDHYKELAQAIDDIAEMIGSLGQKVPCSLDFYIQNSNVKQGNEHFGPMEMIKDLLQSHTVLIQTLKKALITCKKCDDLVSESLMIERLTKHQKYCWILSSHIA
jgi:starvation-inducible DNA-binding protein